jgi:hypothetical protein
MKKLGVLFISLILALGFFSLVLAQSVDSPTAGLENATGGLVDQEGIHTDNVDLTGYKSKAEMRIEAINQWFDNNAPWLKLIFGMVPEISWLFAIDILLILEGIVVLILNADFFLTKGMQSTIARIIGAIIFIYALWFKYPLWAAEKIVALASLWNHWWYKVIVIVLLIILLVLSGFLSKIKKSIRENRAKKQQEKDRKELHEDTEVADKFTDTLTDGGGI